GNPRRQFLTLCAPDDSRTQRHTDDPVVGRRISQNDHETRSTPMAHPLSSHPRNAASTARRLSVASAALILAGGYVHLCLYRHGYRFIPKIGVSFLLQAASSAILAVA